MKRLKRIRKELLIVISLVNLFMCAACVNKIANADQHVAAYLVTIFVSVICLIAWSYIAVSFWHRRKRCKLDIGMIIVLIYSMIIRLPQLWDKPRWDAWSYYQFLMNACTNFDFTIQQFIRDFSLASHPTLGYAGALAIGEFLFPGKYVGLILVNLVLAVSAYGCLYKIWQKILPKAGRKYHIIAACAASSVPLVLGTFSYFQPDMGTVYFFLFTLYCFLYGKNVLMLFSMCLLALSKEIGCVAVAGFVLGVFIYTMFRRGKGSLGQRLLLFLRQPIGYTSALGGIGFLLYFLIFHRSGGEVWNYQVEKFPHFSTFSFQPVFIAYKWKQFFGMNFNWIVWITIICAFLVMFRIHGKTKKYMQEKGILAAFITVWLVLVGFYCSYITFVLPRYHVLIDTLGVLLMLTLLGKWGKKIGIRVYLLGLGLLFLIQSYYTIDPLMLHIFTTSSTGKGRIVAENLMNGIMQRDYTVYNHQFNYLSQSYEEVLKSVNYDGTQDLLNWEAISESEIGGNNLYWNKEKKEYSYKSGYNAIEIEILNKEVLEQNPETNRKEEAVYIHSTQFGVTDEDAEKYVKENYDIRYKGDVESLWGGKITFYVCDLKKEDSKSGE